MRARFSATTGTTAGWRACWRPPRPTAPKLLDRFLAQFGEHLSADSVASLRTWASAPPEGGPSGLTQRLMAAGHQWRLDLDELTTRRAAVDADLPEFERRASSPAATDDDRRAYKIAKGSLKLLGAQINSLTTGLLDLGARTLRRAAQLHAARRRGHPRRRRHLDRPGQQRVHGRRTQLSARLPGGAHRTRPRRHVLRPGPRRHHRRRRPGHRRVQHPRLAGLPAVRMGQAPDHPAPRPHRRRAVRAATAPPSPTSTSTCPSSR